MDQPILNQAMLDYTLTSSLEDDELAQAGNGSDPEALNELS